MPSHERYHTMSDRQIIFILGAPGRGIATLANALRTSIHDNEQLADPLEALALSVSQELGISPNNPTPVDVTHLTGAPLRTHRLEARKLTFAMETQNFPIIHAHPAAAMLIPFWREAFEDTDITVRFVLVGSNAMQSVDELRETETKQDENSLKPEIAMMIWAQATLHSLKFGGSDLIATHYADLLSEPENTINKILNALSFSEKQYSDKRIRKISEEIFTSNQSDRAYTLKDVDRHEEFPVFIKTLNSISSRHFNSTQFSAEETAIINPILENYEEFDFFLTGTSKVTHSNKVLQNRLEEVSTFASATEAANRELDVKITALSERNANLDNRKSNLESELNKLRIEVSSGRKSNNEQLGVLTEKNEALTRTIRDNETAIAELQELLEEQRNASQTKIHELELANASLTAQQNSAEKLAEELRKERTHDKHRYNLERATFIKQQKADKEELQSLRSSTAPEIEGAALPTLNDVQADQSEAVKQAVEDAREQMRLEIEQEKRALKERARTAEQQMLDQESTLSHLKMEAESAQNEVRAIKTSTSWKISAPVRGIKTVIKNPKSAAKSGIKGTGKLLLRAIPGQSQSKKKITTQNIKASPTSLNGEKFPSKKNRLKNGDLDQIDNQSSDYTLNPNPTPAQEKMLTGLDGCVPKIAKTPPARTKARTIAFYLPQYHTIPENDEWWGSGFTEWTNVEPSTAKFPGHYQPHLPGDLGTYNLIEDETILARQAEMAKLHGLAGFAFYFYWFGGKRLLEAPLQRYLDDRTIDFPYCLCWANENWNRRWDGAESEILIAQNHSPEDDIQFISHISQYLRDPRYIHIDGKPLVLVYRPGILPSSRETTDRWREWCHKNGIGDIYLAYTQSFEKIPPNVFGFDAAIEFPPNNHGLLGRPSLIGNNNHTFKGKVFDWRDLVRRSDNYPTSPYKLFRGVNPSWDNTPRRGENGTVLLNSNPKDYYRWLNNAVADTHARISNPQEQLIFINAWNEWAEGAHLEPDQKYGYAWLEATRRAIGEDIVLPTPAISPSIPAKSETAEKKILIITHDLFRHGAQYLSLNFARTLSEKFNYEIAVIACKDGPLRNHFEKLGSLTILEEQTPPATINAQLQALSNDGFNHAIVNSSASGWLSPYLASNKINFVGLVHEMKSIVTSMKLEKNLDGFNTFANEVIFPASIVRDQGATFLPHQQWKNAAILPQGVYKLDNSGTAKEKSRAKDAITKELRIPTDATLVLGVGFADHRKGIDIFLNWAIATNLQFANTHFIWVGEIAQDMCKRVDVILDKAGTLKKYIHLPGFKSETKDYYLAADIYALTSREDPFPSTALEALNAGTPVVMIEGTGGIEDLAASGCVQTCPNETAENFLVTAKPWLKNQKETKQAGMTGAALVQEKFGFVSYVGDLIDRLNPLAPGVSVIVPSYNYERHLEQRLRSIIDQTFPPREILFLDDASTDNSVELAHSLLSKSGIRHRIIVNKENSGNVFAQWQRGIELASQPITWIAEADDWADRDFLASLAPHFTKETLSLAFSQSRQINDDGKIIAPDYRDYVRDISTEKWTNDFHGPGMQEVAEGFGTKNTIPNVSGALFRTLKLQALLSTDIEFARRFRTAGDWYVYVNMLREGSLYFNATPLNYHRRHDNSVTISKFDLADLTEIADMQDYVANEFSLNANHRIAAQTYLKHLIDHFNLHERYSTSELNAATRL